MRSSSTWILLCAPASSRWISFVFVCIWMDTKIGSIHLFLERSQTDPIYGRGGDSEVLSYCVFCETHLIFFPTKKKKVEVWS